jgi:nucleoside-diphosphate-sugar epimerase
VTEERSGASGIDVRIAVAGAAGALGRALAPRLVEEGHTVREITRRELLANDLLELVRGCDAVVHVVGETPAASARAANGIAATRRLLAAAVDCGVPRYVEQSFAVAYRDGGDSWLDEDAPLDACAPVIERETMLRRVDPRTLGWTILRGGSFVGPGTRQDALIERLRSRRAQVAGDGLNYLSPLNVGDMAAAIVVGLERAPAGSTFNIVDEPLRYGDYVDALADLLGVSRPRRRRTQSAPASRRCTNAAAAVLLGWTPRHPIWPSHPVSGV